jgi:hypothetical protein
MLVGEEGLTYNRWHGVPTRVRMKIGCTKFKSLVTTMAISQSVPTSIMGSIDLSTSGACLHI